MLRRKYLIAGVVAIAIAVAAVLFVVLGDKQKEGIIEASGQVRGTEITVSSRISGRVREMLVREGQAIKAGDLIASVSSDEIEARYQQALSRSESFRNRLTEVESSIKALNASIEQARTAVRFAREESTHRLHSAQAAMQRARSDILRAESRFELAKKDFERYSELLKKDVVSRRQFEEVESEYTVAEASLNAARDALEETRAAAGLAEASGIDVKAKEQEVERLFSERDRLRAALKTAEGELNAALAQLRESESQLKETSIYAPSDGTVINRLVESGELVGPGTPVAVLVDLSDIYVRVFIKETDIGKIRLGNPARIFTDAFPDYFEGRITEVSEKAQFTPREAHVKEERAKLVFGVKVGIENPRGYLKPGMPVDVDIKWKEDASW